MKLLLLIACLGLVGCENAHGPAQPMPGRYQLSNGEGRPTVMVDTATARSWVLARDDGQVLSWVEMVRVDSPAPKPLPVR